MMNKAIQNIADLIIIEANNVNSDDLCGAIYHVHHLVRLKLMELADEIRSAEKGWSLRKNSDHK